MKTEFGVCPLPPQECNSELMGNVRLGVAGIEALDDIQSHADVQQADLCQRNCSRVSNFGTAACHRAARRKAQRIRRGYSYLSPLHSLLIKPRIVQLTEEKCLNTPGLFKCKTNRYELEVVGNRVIAGAHAKMDYMQNACPGTG